MLLHDESHPKAGEHVSLSTSDESYEVIDWFDHTDVMKEPVPNRATQDFLDRTVAFDLPRNSDIVLVKGPDAVEILIHDTEIVS